MADDKVLIVMTSGPETPRRCATPFFFASLAAAISASGADIADARVHTTKDGAAFDVFSVQTTDHRPLGLTDRGVLDTLLTRLRSAMYGSTKSRRPALMAAVSRARTAR